MIGSSSSSKRRRILGQVFELWCHIHYEVFSVKVIEWLFKDTQKILEPAVFTAPLRKKSCTLDECGGRILYFFGCCAGDRFPIEG
jgi:hypothetical protein